MYKQHTIRQWFCPVINWQQLHLGLLCATSVCLVLAAPTILQLPESQLLAQKAVSQDLETASLYQQGVTRYHRNDFQGAESAFRLALERDPNLGIARNYLGNILLMQNRLDLAVKEYRQALRINPNLSETYYNLGLALHRQGQEAAAIPAYRQALSIDPTRSAAQYNLGLALYELGQEREAIAAYEAAINLDSSNANAYYNLAIAQQEQGEIEPAIAAYRQVLELEPQNATAYHNLGVILYNQGELQEANGIFKRAYTAYKQQGQLESAEKMKQLIQQIALVIEQQRQATQMANPAENPPPTGNTVMPEITPEFVPVIFNK
ncbi:MULTISPECIES: tetratricopeptide repeat protein [unclassified Nodularia (in: cyanobacteria)]|uniref:tetratricopeptide repeat protein n=1 Tax=unclassified Nodularia (in: cyanobacteria) TaxID=2656917 RepID=UPI001881EE09|nr:MULTISPECIES: tetratricopeptide repeat protein [unclassified Nodularia (in: cyanobacteria)]MBE9201610.1 tetratricopeptide repeat protein [Nodularia sp. LEGE 06071]MCC2691922.1 tetratricopeptide repeat protein [Nodularia sp. LEGE 04288]